MENKNQVAEDHATEETFILFVVDFHGVLLFVIKLKKQDNTADKNDKIDI